jgi:beta-lactamase regulating signal transducer with metallopeptidase domain
MTETALRCLLLGSLSLAAALLAVAVLRTPLRRLAGAETQYQLWLLPPAVLLATLLAALQPAAPLEPWQLLLREPGEMLRAPFAALQVTDVTWGKRDLPSVWLTSALAVWLTGAGGLGVAMALQKRVAGPALVGVWRPQLCLPSDFRRRFPAAERRLILQHERVHAERGDTRWLLLAAVLLCLQWFNPLAWWSYRRLHADMELACDAVVLRRNPGQLATYRRALLRAQPDVAALLPGLVTPWFTHPLIERIAMLPRHTTRRPWVGAALVLLASSLAYAAQPSGLGAEAPPPTPGYSKLRMDLQVSVNGHALEPALLLDTFGSSTRQQFDFGAGEGLELHAQGRPHRDPAIAQGEEVLMLSFVLIDSRTRERLGQPRLATKEGVPARIEFGQQGQRVIRIDVLPRVVSTRLHDGQGARHELLRDIEAGRAPANFFKR